MCSFAVFDFRRQGQGSGHIPVSGINVDAREVGNGPGPGGKAYPDTNVLAVAGLANGKTKSTIPVSGSSARQATQATGVNQLHRARASDNKMEKSFLHFKATHPDWVPDPSSSMFLDKLVLQHQTYQHHHQQGVPIRQQGHGHGMSGSMYAGGRGLGLGTSRHVGHTGQGGGVGRTDMGASFTSASVAALGPSGLGEAELRARSRSYDRAWARSSRLLGNGAAGEIRGAVQASGSTGMKTPERYGRLLSPDSERARLARMEEEEGEEDESERDRDEGMGWAGVPASAGTEEEDGQQHTARFGQHDENQDEERDRFMRDLGLVGILQQIVGPGMGR